MTEAEIREKFVEIVAEQLDVPVEKVANASALDEFNIDSVVMIEILFELEEAFDIRIPNEEAGELNNLEQAVAYVLGKTQAAASA